MRPGALLHIGFGNDYRGRLYAYGRDFGPVTERSYLLSGIRTFSPFKSQILTAGVGAVILSEDTSVRYPDRSNQNASENNFNLGGVFSVGLHLPRGPVSVNVDWDSHIFLAGEAGILLSNGRKQTISLTMGVAL